jgi:hypothetical protein
MTKEEAERKCLEALAMAAGGMSARKVSRAMGIRRPTVDRWLKDGGYTDARGWKAKKMRSHTNAEEKRVVELKKARIDGKKHFFGTEHVQMDYSKAYPDDPLPSAWFVDDVVRRHGLQAHRPKARGKGQDVVSRLLFPIRSIVSLGPIQQSMDFVGRKFILGHKEPITVFSAGYYQGLKLFQIRRVPAEKSEYVLACLAGLWREFPIPDVLRMDNGATWRGSGSAVGTVSRCLRFALNVGVVPLFSAPYQSYTNPHIEGNNRTFVEKVWQRSVFTSTEQLDADCAGFNAESRELYEWKYAARLKGMGARYLGAEEMVPSDVLLPAAGRKVHFIRFVDRWKSEGGCAGFAALNRFVEVPDEYLNQYVFASLDLGSARMTVSSERQGISSVVAQQTFSCTI